MNQLVVNCCRVGLVLGVIAFSAEAPAQQGFPQGARSQAMAGAVSSHYDAWALLANPAGTAHAEGPQAVCTYQRYANSTSGFNSGAAAGLYPWRGWVSGLSFSRFGGELYSEQNIGLSLAHALGNSAFALRGHYLQYAIKDLDATGFLVLELGGITQLTPAFSVGLRAYNLGMTRLSESFEERIPSFLQMGLGYTYEDKLKLAAEVLKDLDQDASMLLGMEYRVVRPVVVRAGFSSPPFSGSFGFGFLLGHLQLDYAFASKPYLGFSNQLSLSYSLR
ncbi:MAG: hypothetical protein HC842_03925 [Cytophagales bacterium]|nr:hypothetical protein [Cytophagales bacterium]